MEKYGFIYLWFDKKHKRYYVGRHWGSINDGYICSSRVMRRAYNRRPTDFKRRIISYIYTCKEDLIIEEQKWLNMINRSEYNKKYYNISPNSHTPSTLGYNHSDETKRKISEANKGRVVSESQKEKNRLASIKQFEDPEQRKKLSTISKSLWQDSEYIAKQKEIRSKDNYYGHSMRGKTHSDETKRRISETKKNTVCTQKYK